MSPRKSPTDDDAIRELDSLSNRNAGHYRSSGEYQVTGNEYHVAKKYHASAHIGFYVDAPVERAPFVAWPPDFNPADVELFANFPPAPEVAKCERCPLAWRTCRPGHFAKYECRERATTPPSKKTFDQEANVALVLDALHAGPASLAEIGTRTGLGYHPVRHAVDMLRKRQQIRLVGRFGSRHSTNVYALDTEGGSR